MKLSLLLFGAISLGIAQPRPPNPPGEPRALKAYLGLSNEQFDQMMKAAEADHKAAAIGKALLEVRATERLIGEIHDTALEAPSPFTRLNKEQSSKAIEDASLLPEATREAIRLGLTPLAPNPPSGPQPMRIGVPNRRPTQPPNQPQPPRAEPR